LPGAPLRQLLWEPLYPNFEPAHVMTRAYYGVLNEHMEFRAALLELYELVIPPWRRSRREADFLLGAPGGSQWARIADSATQWGLPRRHGQRHVADALWWWHVRPRDSDDELPRLFGWSRGFRGEVVCGDIEPHQLGTFSYDPTRQGPEWVRAEADRVAETIRRSIVDQAEALEKQARAKGYRPIPPRYRGDGGELKRMAQRLYRRAVLKWSWQNIARAEHPPEDVRKFYPSRAVRNSVEHWARELDIPLP
jgi:hypothetical protein